MLFIFQFVTTQNSNNNKVAWLLLNRKQDPVTVKPPLPQMMAGQSGTAPAVFYIAGTAERIDQRSRLLFPVFFFFFSFLYWFYYSYWI